MTAGDGAISVVAETRLRELAARRDAMHSSRRGALVRKSLVVADVLGLAIAFLVAELAFGATEPGDRLTMTQEYFLFLATLPGWVMVAKLYKLYDRDDERTDHSTVEDLVGVFHLATVGAWLAFFATWLSGAAQPGMSKLVMFWLLAVALVTLLRAGARWRCRRSAEYVQNAVIVGAGDVGQLVARKLLQHREYGIRLLGFVDDLPRYRRADIGDVALLGSPERLPELVRELGVERVVIAFSNEHHERTLELIGSLKGLGVQVDIVPRLFEAVGPHTVLHSVEGLPLIALPAPKRFPLSRTIKRAWDVVGASILLLLTAPLMALIAWRIKRDSPGPVLFRQVRLGEGMQEFEVLKFRTMHVGTDDAEHREFIRSTMSAQAQPTANGLYKLERGDAITKVGRLLRKTSLDELPQIINVLRGDMSLVGPRPCLAYETELFEPHHYERFAVPAGITGLWQVTARAHSTFGEALEMDVAYARNWSLGLDMLLLVKTPFQVFRQKRGTA